MINKMYNKKQRILAAQCVRAIELAKGKKYTTLFTENELQYDIIYFFFANKVIDPQAKENIYEKNTTLDRKLFQECDT